MTDPQHKPRWLDTTISLQWILSGLAGAIFTLASAIWIWGGGVSAAQAKTDSRLLAMESSDREQEKHFSRIEGALVEQRTDTRDALRGISQDLKELGSKFDQLKDQMISNSVANRPDVQRWSKP
jgi:uncharacterized coiled-coil protein SlyX